MPRYEFKCGGCGHKFEVEATLKEKEKGLKNKCPACGSPKTERLFSSFSTVTKSGGAHPSGCGCCSMKGKPGCHNNDQ